MTTKLDAKTLRWAARLVSKAEPKYRCVLKGCHWDWCQRASKALKNVSEELREQARELERRKP